MKKLIWLLVLFCASCTTLSRERGGEFSFEAQTDVVGASHLIATDKVAIEAIQHGVPVTVLYDGEPTLIVGGAYSQGYGLYGDGWVGDPGSEGQRRSRVSTERRWGDRVEAEYPPLGTLPAPQPGARKTNKTIEQLERENELLKETLFELTQ